MADNKLVNFEVCEHLLDVPDMSEVAKELNDKLVDYFEKVNVSIVDCPDLSQQPFNLASKGICGRTAIADIGGVPYLVPSPDLSKPNYDLIKLAKDAGKLHFSFLPI